MDPPRSPEPPPNNIEPPSTSTSEGSDVPPEIEISPTDAAVFPDFLPDIISPDDKIIDPVG
jgi:hypothetical protein